jgi:hypothetical protein
MRRPCLFAVNNFKRKFEQLPLSVSLSKRCITTPRKEETRLSTKLADGSSVLGGRRPLPERSHARWLWARQRRQSISPRLARHGRPIERPTCWFRFPACSAGPEALWTRLWLCSTFSKSLNPEAVWTTMISPYEHGQTAAQPGNHAHAAKGECRCRTAMS